MRRWTPILVLALGLGLALGALAQSLAPNQLGGGTLAGLASGSGPSLSATTWSLVNKNASISVSGLVATNSANAVMGAATPSQTVGKFYGEFMIGAPLGTGSGNFSVGAVNSSATFGNGSYCGTNVNSICYYPASGQVFYNGAALTTIQTCAQGQIVREALDLTDALVWWACGGGNWNNSGAANPATGAGGISLGALGGASDAVAWGAGGASGGEIIADFGQNFVYAVPATFTYWP